MTRFTTSITSVVYLLLTKGFSNEPLLGELLFKVQLNTLLTLYL